MATLHVILGDQPKADGSVSAGHKVRLNTASMDSDYADCILCTGGKTVPTVSSEAEIARDYLKDRPNTAAIEIEKESRSTAQNFRFSLGILDKYPSHKVIVYCGRAQFPKAWILGKKIWKGRRVQFCILPDHRGLGYILAQVVVGSALSVLDPNEVWLGKLALKKTLRKTVLE